VLCWVCTRPLMLHMRLCLGMRHFGRYQLRALSSKKQIDWLNDLKKWSKRASSETAQPLFRRKPNKAERGVHNLVPNTLHMREIFGHPGSMPSQSSISMVMTGTDGTLQPGDGAAVPIPSPMETGRRATVSGGQATNHTHVPAMMAADPFMPRQSLWPTPSEKASPRTPARPMSMAVVLSPGKTIGFDMEGGVHEMVVLPRRMVVVRAPLPLLRRLRWCLLARCATCFGACLLGVPPALGLACSVCYLLWYLLARCAACVGACLLGVPPALVLACSVRLFWRLLVRCIACFDTYLLYVPSALALACLLCIPSALFLACLLCIPPSLFLCIPPTPPTLFLTRSSY